jgi:hypothetical protein
VGGARRAKKPRGHADIGSYCGGRVGGGGVGVTAAGVAVTSGGASGRPNDGNTSGIRSTSSPSRSAGAAAAAIGYRFRAPGQLPGAGLPPPLGASFETGGWRLPFLFSIVLVGVGLSRPLEAG